MNLCCVICNEPATIERYDEDIILNPYCDKHVPMSLYEHVFDDLG